MNENKFNQLPGYENIFKNLKNVLNQYIKISGSKRIHNFNLNQRNLNDSGFENNLIENDFNPSELIEEIKDTKDNACNVTESHVKVIRLDSEYQFKSTLKCSEYEDYLNSFVEIKSDNNEDNNNATIKPTEPITTTTTTTKRVITTSKKKTTQVRKYTVSFNTNGGSAINDQKITSGNVIISPGAPKRSGYTFVGWYYHGQPFDLNTKINQDYVLVAKWIKN